MFNLYHYFNGLLQKMNLSEKFKRLHGIIIETQSYESWSFQKYEVMSPIAWGLNSTSDSPVFPYQRENHPSSGTGDAPESRRKPPEMMDSNTKKTGRFDYFGFIPEIPEKWWEMDRAAPLGESWLKWKGTRMSMVLSIWIISPLY